MMKDKSEQILSFTENELIDKESIRRAVLSAQPQKQKKTVVWTKVLLPIAACLVLLCGTVLTIPSARAEVLSWFRGNDPGEYLAVAPEDRTPVPVLDELIVPPAPTDVPKETTHEGPAPVVSVLPYGAVTDNRILSVCDEPIWQQIAEDFSIELGETMFDGKELYLAVTYHGLCALPETVPHVGGSATATRLSEEDLAELFEDGMVPADYSRDGVSEWESNEGRYWLQLDNGAEVFLGIANLISSSPNMEREFSNILQSLDVYGPATDAQQDAISDAVIAWLSGKTLRGVIRQSVDLNTYGRLNGKDLPIEDVRQYLLDQADENGILTAKVLYKAGPSGAYLTAELGTVSFDLKAYQSIPAHTPNNADETVVWGAETISISNVGFDFGKAGDQDDRISLYKQTVSAADVTMTAETEETEISELTVRNIGIRTRVPESWTQEDREALANSLTFKVQLNGEYGDWSVGSYSCQVQDDGTVLYRCLELDDVPYETLRNLRTITLIPVIRFVKTLEMHVLNNGEWKTVGTLDTDYGKTKWSPLGVKGWNQEESYASYPQYAIVLTVD